MEGELTVDVIPNKRIGGDHTPIWQFTTNKTVPTLVAISSTNAFGDLVRKDLRKGVNTLHWIRAD